MVAYTVNTLRYSHLGYMVEHGARDHRRMNLECSANYFSQQSTRAKLIANKCPTAHDQGSPICHPFWFLHQQDAIRLDPSGTVDLLAAQFASREPTSEAATWRAIALGGYTLNLRQQQHR